MRFFILMASCALWPGLASAQSWCSAANLNPTEATICSDDILRQLDVEMATLAHDIGPVIRNDQRAWLRDAARDSAARRGPGASLGSVPASAIAPKAAKADSSDVAEFDIRSITIPRTVTAAASGYSSGRLRNPHTSEEAKRMDSVA